MKVIRNYLYNAGYQILAMILPLITAPYVSRVLTPHGYGLNTYTNSIVQYFVLFGSMGIALYGNREIAYKRKNKKEMTKTFWEIQVLKTLGVIISTLCYFFFINIYVKNHLLMVFQSVNLLAAAFDISWLFMGLEDFKRTVLRNTLVKVISLILVFSLVRNASDLPMYILILGMSTLLGNLTLWPPLRKILVPIQFRKMNIFQHLGPAFVLFIPQIATQVYVVLNKTMLGIMSSTDDSGFYFSSDNLVKIVLSIVTATGTVMLPHVSSAFAQGKKSKVNGYLYKSFNFVSFISFPMAFGLAAVSRGLAPYFYGKGYEPVGIAIMIESVVIILIAWSNAIGTQYLLPTKRVKFYTISIILGASVNIIINVPFIYFLGLNGAIISTVLSETVVTLYQIWSIRNLISLRILFKDTFKYLIMSSIMFIPVFLMNMNLKTNALSLGFEVVIGMFIYVLLIFVIKPTITETIKSFLKR